MTKATISVNGGKEIDLDDEQAVAEEFKGKLGHNRRTRPGGVAVDQLKSIVARIEKLSEEKDGIAADIRDVYAEAKGNGFDVPTIRKIIKLRKLDPHERDEQESILDTYLRAMDMQSTFGPEEE